MSLLLWFVFLTFAIASFFPVIRLFPTRKHHNYQSLLYLSITILIWSTIVFFTLISDSGKVSYYLTLFIYPIVFLMTYFILTTVSSFTNVRIRKPFKILAFIFFIFNLSIVLTNPLHQLVLNIPFSADLTYESFLTAEVGPFFLVHTFVSYLILVFAFSRLLIHLRRVSKKKQNSLPFLLLVYSIIIGITFNVVHVFFYTFYLDPSYMFAVLISFILYVIIYKRDFDLAIVTTSRLYLLKQMREKYIVFNDEQIMIECSESLLKTYGFDYNQKLNIKEILKIISQKDILYRDYDEVQGKPLEEKKYYHFKKDVFSIRGFKQKGTLVLLYNETNNVKLLHEIDRLKSMDLMTGLKNRNYFEEQRKNYDESYDELGIIFFDMNALKVINDYLGHKVGDDYLILFSKHLNNLKEKHKDIEVIRLGGDEFLVIIKEATEQLILSLVDEVKKKCRHDNIVKRISFSYGYAMKTRASDQLAQILKRADIMLYEDKKRNQAYRNKLIEAIEQKSD